MRKEFDYYTLRRTNGSLPINRDFHYDSFDDAIRAKEKIESNSFGEPIVICHVEVYKYFDENGFVKEERFIQRSDKE